MPVTIADPSPNEAMLWPRILIARASAIRQPATVTIVSVTAGKRYIYMAITNKGSIARMTWNIMPRVLVPSEKCGAELT